MNLDMPTWMYLIVGVLVLSKIVGFNMVPPGYGGVVVTLGRPGKNVRSGIYFLWWPIQRMVTVSTRSRPFNPGVDDVTTGDGTPVRVNIIASQAVTNPRRYLFEVEDVEKLAVGLARSFLLGAVRGYSNNRLRTDPALLGELGAALDAGLGTLERKTGSLFTKTGIESIQFPGPLEDAYLDVQNARQEYKAQVRRARTEAKVTGIEIGAQGKQWIQKETLDALRAIKNPVVILGTGGQDDQTTLSAPVAAALLQALRDQQTTEKKGGG